MKMRSLKCDAGNVRCYDEIAICFIENDGFFSHNVFNSECSAWHQHTHNSILHVENRTLHCCHEIKHFKHTILHVEC